MSTAWVAWSESGEVIKIDGLSIEWLHGQDICPDELYYNSLPA